MKGKEVVDFMMKNDAFSQWLGIHVLDVGEGNAILEFTVREEMLNGFYILHGGITYSVADSALCICCKFSWNSIRFNRDIYFSHQTR